MTVQPTRDQLRLYATHVARSQKGVAPGIAVEVAEAVPQLLDQLDQAEAELDSWMTRAYEAEKRAWQAEKRIDAVQDVLDRKLPPSARTLAAEVRRALGI